MTQFSNKTYDLEERMAVFGERIFELCKSVPAIPVTRRLIDQLIGSGTGVGANYMEANNASSKRDFRNKIIIAKKESQESKHFLRMLATEVPERKDEIRKLWQEVHELTLILQKINNSMARISRA